MVMGSRERRRCEGGKEGRRETRREGGRERCMGKVGHILPEQTRFFPFFSFSIMQRNLICLASPSLYSCLGSLCSIPFVCKNGGEQTFGQINNSVIFSLLVFGIILLSVVQLLSFFT